MGVPLQLHPGAASSWPYNACAPCACGAPSQADNLPAVDAKIRFRLERIDRVNNEMYFGCTQSNKNVITSALGDDPLQFLNVYSCAIPNMAIGFVA